MTHDCTVLYLVYGLITVPIKYFIFILAPSGLQPVQYMMQFVLQYIQLHFR